MEESQVEESHMDTHAGHDDSWVLTGARLFRAVDDEVIADGAVWVHGGAIRFSGPASDLPSAAADIRRIDLGGRFVMPGMTESHAHLSYTHNGPTELDRTAVEVAMVGTLENARKMLGAGFTSAISFGSVHRIDTTLRDTINAGRAPGPRLLAAGRDVGATASNADLHADHARPTVEGLGFLADGPWAVRKAVRTIRKNGADVVKIFLDGENLSAHAPPGELTYTDEEVAAAVHEAHTRRMRVACHARSAAAVKQAVRHGIDFIGHANYLDDEAVAMLAAARDRITVGPAIAWELRFIECCEQMGFTRAAVRAKGYDAEVAATITSMKRLHAAGVRVLVGGDYGLNITPHGTYARDLQYFVELFGFTPAEALLAATRDGGWAFDRGGMLGTLEADTHADLVIVDGDPLADIRVLQDPARIHAVVKGGRVYRGLLDVTDPWRIAPDRLGSAIARPADRHDLAAD